MSSTDSARVDTQEWRFFLGGGGVIVARHSGAEAVQMLCPFLLTEHGRIEIPHAGLFRFKMDALKTPANYTFRLCATDDDGEQLNT